jgi:GT2 family glycosyltransferase
MQDVFVYIIIVNYGQWQDTCDCLDSVFQSSFTGYSVIVVDNNSPNATFLQLVDWANQKKRDHVQFTKEAFQKTFNHSMRSPLMFIRNDTNAGFAAANNIALSLLSDLDVYVWLLNPDMLVARETLQHLVECSSKHQKQTVFGATIHTAKGNPEPNFYGGGRINYMFAQVRPARKIKQSSRLDYISGTSLFTHANNFKTYGLLPGNYFLYWEETDWCHNARAMGAKLEVCMKAVCFDKGSTTIGKGFLAHYYYCRNGLLFVSKYKKSNLPFAICSMGFRILKRVVKGEMAIAKGIFKGTRHFLKKRFDAYQ